jgi:hypothetical protein
LANVEANHRSGAVSYNMWFLTPSSEVAPAEEWIDFVGALGEGQQAELAAGGPKDWRQICITYTDGSWSFDFERYTVGGSGRWTQDLSFFNGWLGVREPVVNTQWLMQYLTRVRTVYMFRCSNSAPDSNLELVREIVDSLRHDDENGGESGLLYAELEGWSNENGHHLTWEFSDRVSGPWWMALRRDEGWETFQMELGNRAHRQAFKSGQVPAGVESQLWRD